ncbi:MAG: hypothetical protein IID63_06560 [candidate division Zixibacteria bacterium]|nr:hypothetical protein [candidate division Zixibacteria bacterium]
MKVRGKQVTKEWYQCKRFEKVLKKLWAEKPAVEFSRQTLLDRINSGEFGENLLATFSPAEGSVGEIYLSHQVNGRVWLDIQNLTYHYSHENLNGNFHSHIRMLDHVSGKGANSVYKLHINAFMN